MYIKKVLIGSPVRQKHHILGEFLKGLDEMDKNGFEVCYYFVDDNTDIQSTYLLKNFAKDKNVIIKYGKDLTSLNKYSNYISDDVTHIWDASSIRKVAYFKDSIIEYAIENKFDYLFFVDSDIVVDKRTLKHLATREVDIISNVFWTQWQPNWELEPQCFWMPALNRQSKAPFAPQIDQAVARQIQKNFFAQMRVPGMYKVDGLGACTLITRHALEKGARFKEIPNLALLGEDRHFCVRAGAVGLDLYFDTVYPVYHIYREEYLNRVDEFKKEGFKYDMCQTYTVNHIEHKKDSEIFRIVKKVFLYINNKINAKIQSKKNQKLVYTNKNNNSICALISVQNEDLSSLEEMLDGLRHIVSFFVLSDNTSSNILSEICEKNLSNCSYTICKDSNYQALWVKAQKYNPGWICCIDSNEIISNHIIDAIKYLVGNQFIDMYRFKSNITNDIKPYLMRYQSGYNFKWNEECDRFPQEVNSVAYADMEYVIKCKD